MIEFSESFYLGIIGIGVGVVYQILKLIQHQKCISCSFCFGCCKIERDTLAETKEHEFNVEHNINDQIVIPEIKENQTINIADNK